MASDLRTFWIALTETSRLVPLRVEVGKPYRFHAGGVGWVTVTVDPGGDSPLRDDLPPLAA